MSILVDKSNRVVIQGITGSIGKYIAGRMKSFSDANLVAGVTPGKGGQTVEGTPVYDTVNEAVKEVSADTSAIYVPPASAADAIIEAADSGIKLAVVYTEGVPVHAAARAIEYASSRHMRVIGPNAAGVASPGKANVSEFDNAWLKPGIIGIVSKSGTLTYDVLKFSSNYRGVSTIACLGGDQIPGTRIADVLYMFENDPETKIVIMLGEIGGTDEIMAAKVVKGMSKPVVAYICGLYAPKEKPMGHAGAIQSKHSDTAAAKTEALGASGARTARTRYEIFRIISGLL
jgi:succinyl-CoA synthetase alpha subunit